MAKIKSVSSNHTLDYSTSTTIPKGKIYHWFQYLLAFALITMAYWGVTTNSDWGGYVHWFENDATGTDRAFQFLTMWFNDHGMTFRMLYRFHILLIAFFYVLLFRKLRINPVAFSILMLLFNYVAMGNQIRYYVGFPMALLSFYYFVDKKFVLSAVLGVFAFFFHSSIALFFAIFFFYYFVLIKFKPSNRLISIILTNIVLFYLIHNTGISENFETYLTEVTRISGTLGGLYNLFPSIVYMYFANLIDKEIKKANPSYALTEEYKYLYTCIMMGSVLFLTSIPTQIIAHRMMGIILLPIWLTFFLRARSIGGKKIKDIVNTCLIVLFLFFTLNAFGVITGAKDYIYQTEEMLDSYSLK